jgi:hypothetical protein
MPHFKSLLGNRQSFVWHQTVDPLQHVHEAVLGNGEVGQLQFFPRKVEGICKKYKYINRLL